MVLRSIWQLLNKSLTHKILNGLDIAQSVALKSWIEPKRSWGPYNMFGVTDQSKNYRFDGIAMNCLLYYTQLNNTACFSIK